MKTKYLYENICDWVCFVFLGILLIYSCGCEKIVNSYDRTFMVRDGVEIHQSNFPVSISCHQDFNCGEVQNAIDWWEAELEVYWDIFCEELPDPRPCLELSSIATIIDDDAMIYVAEHETHHGTAGTTFLTFDTVTGLIHYADVHISPWYHTRWILYHELGHAIFGLDDDVRSLDLNSIMSSPTLEYSHVTEQDAFWIFQKMAFGRK